MLLDLQMPRKNGIEVVKEVRKIYKFMSIENNVTLIEPNFIFFTAYSSINFKKYTK